jgi:hypothetical protein
VNKRKHKGKWPTPSAHKNIKSHKEPTIYTMIDDDIDRINFQVRDSIEEAVQ